MNSQDIIKEKAIDLAMKRNECNQSNMMHGCFIMDAGTKWHGKWNLRI